MNHSLEQSPSDGESIRPVVRVSDHGNRNLLIFGTVLLLGGLLFFQMLSASRQAALAPTTQASSSSGGTLTSPPRLRVPPRFADALQREFPPTALERSLTPMGPTTDTNVIPRSGPTAEVPAFPEAQAPLPLPASLIIEQTSLPRRQDEAAQNEDRVSAGRLRNPSFTVPQGTIIAAVLETALDSTRPGAARAIVSRDVYSFDGSRILIPKGSRLYGEYGADVSLGINRAFITWQRLTRPDAVIIQLDSPAADPLGRSGVKGKVDSKFLPRFGTAILQSVLDIGVGIATRKATNGVIVALPGSTQNVTGVEPSQVQPTLRVRQGKSVSVFVARDLDFSSVDN